MTTEIEIGEYKNNPTFIIHELDDKGQRKQYPLLTVGVKKAKALLKHMDELSDFVAEEKKES